MRLILKLGLIVLLGVAVNSAFAPIVGYRQLLERSRTIRATMEVVYAYR